ncbi:hypothetical protein E2C01_075638 [Portunus trituberculatus]|uniref:Uncharacterized protein n=1 Tax=Portunus trituberculatus TaxID=210409 RepID=A0A5B7IJN3_PORTR|nr:hypothetical protein [Portunus trituberculatus]
MSPAVLLPLSPTSLPATSTTPAYKITVFSLCSVVKALGEKERNGVGRVVLLSSALFKRRLDKSRVVCVPCEGPHVPEACRGPTGTGNV